MIMFCLPLCMGDDRVASLPSRVAFTPLGVAHVQLPAGLVVGIPVKHLISSLDFYVTLSSPLFLWKWISGHLVSKLFSNQVFLRLSPKDIKASSIGTLHELVILTHWGKGEGRHQQHSLREWDLLLQNQSHPPAQNIFFGMFTVKGLGQSSVSHYQHLKELFIKWAA